MRGGSEDGQWSSGFSHPLRSTRPAPRSAHYSVFPELVHRDAYCCIRRGIRWAQRERGKRRASQQDDGDAEPPQPQPQPPAASSAQSVLSSSSSSLGGSASQSQAARQLRPSAAQRVHSETRSAASGSRQSTAAAAAPLMLRASSWDDSQSASRSSASSGSSASEAELRSSSASASSAEVEEAREGADAAVLIKSLRPSSPAWSPPSSPHSLQRYTAAHLRMEHGLCKRLPSLSPCLLLNDGDGQDEQTVLVCTDHGGQSLTDLCGIGLLEPAVDAAATRTAAALVGEEGSSLLPGAAAAPASVLSTLGASIRFSLSEFLQLCVAVAERLSELHSCGLVYNFLSPAMILYRSAGDRPHAQLLDFCFASLTAAAAAASAPAAASVSLPRPPLPPHCLHYTAPERLESSDSSLPLPLLSSDPRSDLYSLGCVLHELVSGRPPFASASPELLQMRHWHRARQPPQLRFPQRWRDEAKDGETLRLLADIVALLLHKAADDRYQTADGLLWDLRLVLSTQDDSGGGQQQPAAARYVVGSRDRAATLRLSTQLYGREDTMRQLLQLATAPPAQPQPEPGKTQRCQLALLTGVVGSGRTAVLELLARTLRHRGLWSVMVARFASPPLPAAGGGGDSLPGVVCLLRALQPLVIHCLTHTDSVEQAKARLSRAVAGHAPLCRRLLPQLLPFMDGLPAAASRSSLSARVPPLLPPTAEQPLDDEAAALLLQMLAVFPGAGHRLLLLVDDLQLCDDSGLRALQKLMAEAELPGGLLIVAAVAEQLPLSAAAEAGAAAGRRDGGFSDAASSGFLSSDSALRLRLEPLSSRDVLRLLQDSLPAPAEPPVSGSASLPELAQLLWLRSCGHPAELHRAVLQLHRQALLRFDYAAGRWDWDLRRLRFVPLDGCAAQLLCAQLLQLSAEQSRAVKVAACIGSRSSVAAVALCLGQPVAAVYEQLRACAARGLLLPLDGPLLPPPAAELDGDGDQGDALPDFRFSQQEVEQSAYALCSAALRQHVHLSYARSLLQLSGRERAYALQEAAASGPQAEQAAEQAALQRKVERHILELVHHYRRAAAALQPRPPAASTAASTSAFVSDSYDCSAELLKAEELRQVVTFSLAASRRAQQLRRPSLAHECARFAYELCQTLESFSHALTEARMTVTLPSLWASEYELVLAVARQLASLSYHRGDVTAADAVLSTALLHAKTVMDHVHLHELRLDAALVRGECAEAIATGLQILELLGTRLSRSFEPQQMAAWLTPQAVGQLLTPALAKQAVRPGGQTDVSVLTSYYLSRLLIPCWLSGRYLLDVLSSAALRMHSDGCTLYDTLAIALYSLPLLQAELSAGSVELASSLCQATLDYFHSNAEQYTRSRSAVRLMQLQVTVVFLAVVAPWRLPLREAALLLDEARRSVSTQADDEGGSSSIAVGHADYHSVEAMFWSGLPLQRVLAAQQQAARSACSRGLMLYSPHYHATQLILSTLIAHHANAQLQPPPDSASPPFVSVSPTPLADGRLSSPQLESAAAVGASATAELSTIDLTLEVERRVSLLSAARSPLLQAVCEAWLLQYYFLSDTHQPAIRLWQRMQQQQQQQQQRAAAGLASFPQAAFYAALCMLTQACALLPRHVALRTVGGRAAAAGSSSAADGDAGVQALLPPLRSVLAEFHNWAEVCPVNYGAQSDLLDAETAKLEMLRGAQTPVQSYFLALQLYDRAIASARDSGCLPVEAVGCELAARFTILFSRHQEARAYLVQAVDAFGLWGAGLKVEALTAEFADLISGAQPLRSAVEAASSLHSAAALTPASPLQPSAAEAAAPHRSVFSPLTLGDDAAGLMKMTQQFSVETDLHTLLVKAARSGAAQHRRLSRRSSAADRLLAVPLLPAALPLVLSCCASRCVMLAPPVVGC